MYAIIIYRHIAAHIRIWMGHNARIVKAPATQISVDHDIKMSANANPVLSPAQEIAVMQQVKVLLRSNPLLSPAQEIAAKRQVQISLRANLVACKRAVAIYIKKILTPHIAKLKSCIGSVVKCSNVINLGQTAKAVVAESAMMKSRFNKLQTGSEAVGNSAPAQIVPEIESTFTANHTAKASSGKAVDINIDSLTNVTHSAKLATWFFPEQYANTLRFFQVFSGVQSGEVLEIDLETESTYWANAKVTDGALKLVFAETVIPEDKTLEVV